MESQTQKWRTIMSAQRYDERETKNNASKHNDSNGVININGKLERRRRIEDLNEERRLKSELNEYLGM